VSEQEQNISWQAGYLAGKLLAQERIIKLLEQMPQNDGAKSAGFGDLLDRQAAIAFIKGKPDA
jgi:hypothetical protein